MGRLDWEDDLMIVDQSWVAGYGPCGRGGPNG